MKTDSSGGLEVLNCDDLKNTAKRAPKTKTVSVYTLLSKWLNDGSKTSKIPDEVVKNKAIGPQYLLYYFQASPYIMYISKTFNNYGVFQLDRLQVFHFLKKSVRLSGFRPKYIPRYNTTRQKLWKILRDKYPYLKSYDIETLIDHIESRDDKDVIYEMYGLSKPKKKRVTKKERQAKKEVETKVEDSPVKEKNSFSALLSHFEFEGESP